VIDPANLRPAPPAAVVQPLKTGAFPYQAYVATCQCIDGQPEPARNYQGHPIAGPSCSVCRKLYQLDITLMPTYQPKTSARARGKERG
jgi:hypothetical protein